MGKYRVYEVAKDLGLTSKDIINLVKDYTGVEKKHMTALSEEELNIIFEYYTQHNQVESFDDYFAQAPEKPKTSKKSTSPTTCYHISIIATKTLVKSGL